MSATENLWRCFDEMPASKMATWWLDSCTSWMLFLYYLPSHVSTGAPLPYQMLIEPTRASMGPWLGSNICFPGVKQAEAAKPGP